MKKINSATKAVGSTAKNLTGKKARTEEKSALETPAPAPADPVVSVKVKETKPTKPTKAAKPTKKESKVAAKPAKEPTAGRDSLGGRVGTAASKINQFIVERKGKGCTCSEVVEATSVNVTAVSMQLRAQLAAGRVTRKEEKVSDSKRVVFRYTLVDAKEAA
jgi:hypothetical protein